jgi:hypothetical protein
MIRDMQLVPIPGGPHSIPWTQADQVNDALVQFVGMGATSMAH